MKKLKTLLSSLAAGVLLFSVTSIPVSAATNGKIVFTKFVGGNPTGIYSVNADGSDDTAIVEGFAAYPNTSPDGTRVTYMGSDGEGVIPDVRVVNTDGQLVTQLGKQVSFDAFMYYAYGGLIQWTGDGNKLVLPYDVDHSNTVTSMDPDGSNVVSTGITLEDEQYVYHLRYSPDGSMITYGIANQEEGTSNIYIAEADGSNPTHITTSVEAILPIFSPDGDKLYFFGSDNLAVAGGYLYSISIDGSNETQVQEYDGSFEDLLFSTLSPDGTKIAIPSNSTLIIVKTDGSDAQTYHLGDLLEGENWFDGFVSWSPDSTKLAFSLPLLYDEDRRADIFTMNADGTGFTNITNTSDVGETISYNPQAWGAATSSPSNTATVTSLNGTEITIETPSGTTITCSSVSEEASASSDDTNYTYPLGLVNFCFDTEDEDNAVTLTFITDLKPNEVTPRKYSPNTKTYTTLTEASVTETEVEGQHALAVTYTITDNGDLDLNPEEGSIEDPVGLATTADSLASTGQNTAMVLSAAILLSFVGLSIATITMRNKSV